MMISNKSLFGSLAAAALVWPNAVVVNAYTAGPCESLVGSGTVECLTSEVCGDNECSPTAGSCKDGACMDVLGNPTSCETPTNKCGDVFCPGVTMDGTCFCSGGDSCLQLQQPCESGSWDGEGACKEGGGVTITGGGDVTITGGGSGAMAADRSLVVPSIVGCVVAMLAFLRHD